jgi:Do/DeqQ family serine protease
MTEKDGTQRRVRMALTGVLLATGGLLLGIVLTTALPSGGPRNAVSSAPAGAIPPDSQRLEVPRALGEPGRPSVPLTESPFVQVVQQVLPAVVSIEARRTMTHPPVEGPQRELFRELFPEGPDSTGGEIQVPSNGSGFIIDGMGYVLTNDHVVTGSETMTVHLADGRTFEAWLVGTDPGTDVAVLKLDVVAGGDPLPTISLGDSEEMRVGDWAIAIGNPLGELEGTVTVGIISAKGRKDLLIAGGGPAYQDFLQTDASINFGNSGGPLVNTRGEVIGINSAVNPSGQGIGFAIPINMVRKVAAELIRTGTIRRGYLGIFPQPVTAELREAWDLPGLKGILVGSVEEGTPAAEGGIEVGDVILAFNGKPVEEVADFRALVADAGVGEGVPIRLLRGGKEKDYRVVLAERPGAPTPPARRARESDAGVLGATLVDITEKLRHDFGLEAESGVVVSEVRGGSPAREGGLRPGDRVLEINRTRIATAEEAQNEVNKAHSGKKPLVILVQRGSTTTYVSIRLEG